MGTSAPSRSVSRESSITHAPTSPSTGLMPISSDLLRIPSISAPLSTTRILIQSRWDSVTHLSGEKSSQYCHSRFSGVQFNSKDQKKLKEEER